ncbi:unnamed protein product [Amoebophrya sp. A25]|nr:unnamed protein product [Amoebophrya sp. A25]|eukprot:GSA25T00004690001.1
MDLLGSCVSTAVECCTAETCDGDLPPSYGQIDSRHQDPRDEESIDRMFFGGAKSAGGGLPSLGTVSTASLSGGLGGVHSLSVRPGGLTLPTSGLLQPPVSIFGVPRGQLLSSNSSSTAGVLGLPDTFKSNGARQGQEPLTQLPPRAYFERDSAEIASFTRPPSSSSPVTLSSGSVYSGQWKRITLKTSSSENPSKIEGTTTKWVRHGTGQMSWPDGTKYVGEWHDDKAHGKGQLDYASGADHYCGEWKENRCDGFGVYIHGETIFYGEWKNDRQQGHGVESWGEGSKFEGRFENGVKNGHGVYVWPDQSEYQGTWQANKLEGLGLYTAEDKNFRGEWKNSLIHGLGIYRWGDGRSYAGEYVDDKKHGFGTFLWADGRRYEGFWRVGKQEGPGIFTRRDGTQIEGVWLQGKRTN